MRSWVLLVAMLSLGSASCLFRHHQARAFVPPPPKPFVLPPIPQVPSFDADASAEPSFCDACLPTWPFPDLSALIPELPPPPPVAPPKRPPVVATPKPVPAPVPVEPPPSPRLGQIFTAEQLREYNRSLDESLTRVRTVLAAAGARSLTAEQAGMVTRIRTFMMQAEQTRPQDLVTAVSLAKRADLLAQDLAARLP